MYLSKIHSQNPALVYSQTALQRHAHHRAESRINPARSVELPVPDSSHTALKFCSNFAIGTYPRPGLASPSYDKGRYRENEQGRDYTTSICVDVMHRLYQCITMQTPAQCQEKNPDIKADGPVANVEEVVLDAFLE